MQRLPAFNSQDLANTMWSLATLKVQQPEFMDKLCAASMEKLKDFNSQNLANTMYSSRKCCLASLIV